METRTFKEWPAVLQRRWMLTGAAGAGFLLVGLVMYFTLSDRTTLILSGLLAACTALRCLSFYRMIREGAYETAEGVCIEIGRAGLRRHRGVRLLQNDGNECVLTLDKRIRLRVGNSYRIYFRRDNSSNGLVPNLLAGDLFLGLEDMGEFHGETFGETNAAHWAGDPPADTAQ